MKIPEKIIISYYGDPEKKPFAPGHKGYLSAAGLKIPLHLQLGDGKRNRGASYQGEFVESWKTGFKIEITRKR